MDYFIVGLGNPGTKYEKTRHNVAWIILHGLFAHGWEDDKYLKARYLNDKGLHYILPQTFMNNSGESIAGLKKMFSSFSPERLIVIYDDIDLPLGKVRISFDRGAGGHNGVKSIANHLGSKKFIRVRVGIAKTLEDGTVVKPAVLGRFEREEYRKVIQEILPRTEEALDGITEEGYQKAMNKYNAKK